jgi:glycosyltransferase involved in cell wall biosynthesis
MSIAPQTIDPPASAPDNYRPVRVVHLVSTLNMGGLEKVVYDLVRCSDRQQFSMHVLCLGEVGDLGPKFEEIGVTVEGLGVLDCGILRCAMAVARRLRVLQPDVLHTHNPAPHLIGAIAACISGRPAVVHTKHGRNYPKIKKKVFGNRLASWLSERIVAVSLDAADVARRVENVPDRKIEMIWNGIDLDRFPRTTRPARGPERRAIHVARIEFHAKDQPTLLRAVRLVADAEPSFILDIVGDGPNRNELEALCDELHLRRHVRFLGQRDDVHALMSQAEFFVLSSVTEGLSITLLEAMATGLPIVATQVGGNAEVVVDEETGLLVPPSSPEALAAAMLALLRDPKRAQTMGVAARRRVEGSFDLRRVVERYEALYESFVERDVSTVLGNRSQV